MVEPRWHLAFLVSGVTGLDFGREHDDSRLQDGLEGAVGNGKAVAVLRFECVSWDANHSRHQQFDILQ